jgi:hypothetical protein
MTGELSAAARHPGGAVTLTQNELEELVTDIAEDAAEKAVRKVFKEIGIVVTNDDKIEETRRNFDRLRRWCSMIDGAAASIGRVFITVVMGGFLLLLWVGFRTHILKQP